MTRAPATPHGRFRTTPEPTGLPCRGSGMDCSGSRPRAAEENEVLVSSGLSGADVLDDENAIVREVSTDQV